MCEGRRVKGETEEHAVFNNFLSFSLTQDYATELKMFELINFKKIFFIVYISITSQNSKRGTSKFAQQT